MLPTFLGIGVQRAATTWLHDCLSEHPDVFVPAEKELSFFNKHFEKGMGWYEQKFDSRKSQSAVGEITPTYMHTTPISRIHEFLPNTRIIVILRDPVDRAYSAYQLLQEKFNGMSFEEVCESPRGDLLINWSLYADRLSDVYEVYPAGQIKVCLYDDISTKPEQVLAEIFQFIGVDPGFRPEALRKRPNRIIAPKFQRVLERYGMGWTIPLVKASPVGNAIRKWSLRDTRSQPVKETNRRDRLRTAFAEDISKLEMLIQRDLSSWR